MTPGDVALARVPEGPVVDRKPRPAIVVATLPSLVPTVLLCGISSRIDNRLDEEVVHGAGHRPLRLHGSEPTAQKLAKAARFLDLPKDRFDGLLAELVDLLAFGGGEPIAHDVAVQRAV